MTQGILSSVSGVLNAKRRQEVTANNIANVQTPGYRASRLESADRATGGVETAGISRNMTPGPLVMTGRDFDLAIAGPSYFQVKTPNGPRYTRAGNFRPDAQGYLTDGQGHRLAPEIQVPDDAVMVSVSPDGVVSSVGPDNEHEELGTIELTRFTNPEGLSAEGNNLFSATPSSGPPQNGTAGDGFGQVVPGALESSNVDIAAEIPTQIMNMHAFRMNIAALETQNEMLGMLIDITQ
jgi:flagellar basal-body rod protein FlgG